MSDKISKGGEHPTSPSVVILQRGPNHPMKFLKPLFGHIDCETAQLS